jgi:long-chain acyl-CoA synthetase
VTSAGKNVAPAVIERLLTADPLFEQAVVYGDGRNFITAVVVPDGGELQSVAESLGCEVICDDGFVTSSELLEYIDSRVQNLMQAVSNPERVKRCLVLEKPFGLEDDELTATLKVRRRHIIAKYEDRLASFYDG